MGSGSWVVHEGFLLCPQRDATAHGTTSTGHTPSAPSGFTELYAVLTLKRKLEFYDACDAATRTRVDAACLKGFAAWDGDGLLQVHAYGLTLKVERKAHSRMHVAALNRVDLDKWCRAFVGTSEREGA